MPKTSGLGDGLIVDGVDLSGDTGGLNTIAPSRPTHTTTGIDSSGIERIHLRRDGRIDWSTHFNPANTGNDESAHEELSPLPTSDRIVTYLRGRTLGHPAASMVAKQLNYDPERSNDGSLSIGLQARANGFGLEWGTQLTAGIDSFSGAGSGSGVDFGSSTSFGLQAYLHVLSFTGTDATVTLQESSDDGSADSYANVTGAAFDQITSGPQAQRIQTARDQTVEPWLRADVTTSGGFDSLDLVVMVVKNLHTVRFGAA